MHGDGTAKRLPCHIQEQQVSTAVDGGGSASVIVILSAVSKEEVEAVIEVDATLLKHTDLGGGRPAMCTGEVVQECIYRAEEATFLARAVVRCIWTSLAVAMRVVVGWPGVAAIGHVRTWDTDVFH